jgi:hypothetical protein
MSPYGGTAMDGDGRMIVASDDSHRDEAQQPHQPAPSLVPCCDESCLCTPVAHYTHTNTTPPTRFSTQDRICLETE